MPKEIIVVSFLRFSVINTEGMPIKETLTVFAEFISLKSARLFEKQSMDGFGRAKL